MPGPAPPARVTLRVAAVLLGLCLLLAATACTGRKGRNDDDPGPHDYSIRFGVPAATLHDR